MSESHWIPLESTPPDLISSPRGVGATAPFEVCVKGFGVRSFFSALERLRGDEVVTRTIERLPDPIQESIVLRKIGSNEWYPIGWLRELHRAAQSVTGEGAALSRLIGYEAVREDFNGALRALAFVLSPYAMVRRGPRIFRTYCRPGQMCVLEARAGHLRAHWSGCSGFDSGVWHAILGGCEAVLKVCGAHDVDLTVLSGAGEHDSRAEVIALWS